MATIQQCPVSVIDAITGSPIPTANLFLGTGPAPIASDNNGAFILNWDTSQLGILVATAPGYSDSQPQTVPIGSLPPSQIPLTANGPATQSLTITVEPSQPLHTPSVWRWSIPGFFPHAKAKRPRASALRSSSAPPWIIPWQRVATVDVSGLGGVWSYRLLLSCR